MRPLAGKGARLLDDARPGWAAEVGTDRLAIEACDRCVLGQLYGDYLAGADALGIDSFERAIEHGFSSRDDDGRAYRALAEAWRGEIRARLGGRPT